MRLYLFSRVQGRWPHFLSRLDIKCQGLGEGHLPSGSELSEADTQGRFRPPSVLVCLMMLLVKDKEEEKKQRRKGLDCLESVAEILYLWGGRFHENKTQNKTPSCCLPGGRADLLCECAPHLLPWTRLMSWSLLGLRDRSSRKFHHPLSFLAVGTLI